MSIIWGKYKVLKRQEFFHGDYSIVPIRYDDRFDIMKWRNEQIYHLRQFEKLTQESQNLYFDNVISKVFDDPAPQQILFSYLKNDKCIGYGGLVHINWLDKNAEISFIINTSLETHEFELHWFTFLELIERVSFLEIGLLKIFTYAYDLRPRLFNVLNESGYLNEAILKDHCLYDNSLIDVLIHSKFNREIILNKASPKDVEITYKWAIDESVRKYSITKHKIEYNDHKKWFRQKLVADNCYYFLAYLSNLKVGSYRMDIIEDGLARISYLIDPKFQGRGLGKRVIINGIEVAKRIENIKVLIAETFEENIASIKIFENLGFELIKRGRLMTYKLELK